MTKLNDLILSRQSTRKYTDKAIPNALLLECIDAARLAPSASNSQPWKFIVVDDAHKKEAIAKTTYGTAVPFNKFVAQAPAIVVITLESETTVTRLGRAIKKKEWRLIDIGIAAEHFCLQAEELGLGTCMIGWFREKNAKEILDIPKNKSIALMISVGYPPEGYRKRTKIRKGIDEITTFNGYNNSVK